VPFEWVTPTSTWHAVLFVGMGIMAGTGHYFLTIAYSQAPAAVVTPFNYTQLIGSAILGYAVFHDFPDLWTWVGAAVIIASGLYIGYREHVRHRGKA
jgi:drug/metabolite transporter (DMT)-like permease